MSLAYKVYNGKTLIASTASAFLAAHVCYVVTRGVVKCAGRIVWNDEKDRGMLNTHLAAEVIKERVVHHRNQRAAKYAALQNGSAST
jgi:hypothetical protein